MERARIGYGNFLVEASILSTENESDWEINLLMWCCGGDGR